MEMLLTVLATWLSINFGLPALDEHPRVEFASAAKMAELRFGPITPSVVKGAAASQFAEFDHDLQAIYDDQSRTIYLLEGWTGTTPAESSVFVHELVHHLQHAAGLKYACAEAREKPAYQAQERWLEFFGTSLADEFQMDAMTILVRTGCMH